VEEIEYLYKILVVGDLGCGKTSIIHRYVNNIFSTKYRATIGVDFALKVMAWDAKTSVRLQLWDIAGQERFGHMTRVYYKEAVGALVVYDVTRPGTFEAVKKWKTDLDENLSTAERPLPVVLLANKCDLCEHGLDKDKMDTYIKDNGFIGWFETSAKEDINITKAVKALVSHILENDPDAIVEKERGQVLKLGSDDQKDDKSKKNDSCC
jgi:small GTP-binding protein